MPPDDAPLSSAAAEPSAEASTPPGGAQRPASSAAPRVIEGSGSFVAGVGMIGLQHDALPQTFVGKDGSFTFETAAGESVTIAMEFEGTVGGLGMRIVEPDGSIEISAPADGSGATSLEASYVDVDAGAWSVEPEVFGPRVQATYRFVATIAPGQPA